MMKCWYSFSDKITDLKETLVNYLNMEIIKKHSSVLEVLKHGVEITILIYICKDFVQHIPLMISWEDDIFFYLFLPCCLVYFLFYFKNLLSLLMKHIHQQREKIWLLLL